MKDIIEQIDETLATEGILTAYLPIDVTTTSAQKFMIDRYYNTSQKDFIDDDTLINIIQEVFYAVDKYNFKISASILELKFRIFAGHARVDFWPIEGKFEVFIDQLNLTDANYQPVLQDLANLYKFLVEIPGQ